MKARNLLIVFLCTIFVQQSYGQYEELSEGERLDQINQKSEPLRLLVEDIRRAVYASEKDLKDCLPEFSNATITLEGTAEGEAGFELNLVFFKISSKKKKGKTTKSVITFVRDTIFTELLATPRKRGDRNFNIIRNMIVSQAFSNCPSFTTQTQIASFVEYAREVKAQIANVEQESFLDKLSSFPMVASREIMSEAFKTQKLEVEVSFVIEKEVGVSGEFKISPVTGSLSGNLKRKKVQTVKVIFGKDPE